MSKTSSDISTFTVSDLPEISDISHNDLLMVSDYENRDGNISCFTRKMTLSSLFSTIADDSIISGGIVDSSSNLGRAIDSKLSKQVSAEVQKQMQEDLTLKVLAIISANFNTVNDLLDGTLDEQQIIDGSVQENW